MNKYAKLLSRIIVVTAILAGVLYGVDYAVLRTRVAHGTAYGTVEIHQFLATSLKGSKTEYDMTGSFQQQCTHSIFPQQGNAPCWWLERHNAQWQ